MYIYIYIYIYIYKISWTDKYYIYKKYVIINMNIQLYVSVSYE